LDFLQYRKIPVVGKINNDTFGNEKCSGSWYSRPSPYEGCRDTSFRDRTSGFTAG
jgi:hypothetical protein